MEKCFVFLFLFLYCNILKADTKIDEPVNVILPLVTYNGAGYLFSYPEECTYALDAFAAIASDFTKCSIQNARPIKLCVNCVNQYVKFSEKYKALMDTIVNGTSCKSIFISHDRLDAVLEYHDNILSIWNKGHCSACFDWSSGSPVVSNETNNFNTKYNETMTCILKYMNASNNSDEACEKCMQSYLQLDNYYKSLSSDSIGVDSVCMDIVDSMNATRSIWSKTLNCCRMRQSPEIVFLVCTGIVSFLPLLYYVILRFCGPIRDLPNVLKQSRFKQTILQSLNRRIN